MTTHSFPKNPILGGPQIDLKDFSRGEYRVRLMELDRSPVAPQLRENQSVDYDTLGMLALEGRDILMLLPQGNGVAYFAKRIREHMDADFGLRTVMVGRESNGRHAVMWSATFNTGCTMRLIVPSLDQEVCPETRGLLPEFILCARGLDRLHPDVLPLMNYGHWAIFETGDPRDDYPMIHSTGDSSTADLRMYGTHGYGMTVDDIVVSGEPFADVVTRCDSSDWLRPVVRS